MNQDAISIINKVVEEASNSADALLLEWERQGLVKNVSILHDRKNNVLLACQAWFMHSLQEPPEGNTIKNDIKYEFRVGKNRVIKVSDIIHNSIPSILASLFTGLSLMAGEYLTAGAFSVTALSSFLDSFYRTIIKLNPEEALIVDTVIRERLSQTSSKTSEWTRLAVVIDYAAREHSISKAKARRIIDGLRIKNVLVVSDSRPKRIWLKT